MRHPAAAGEVEGGGEEAGAGAGAGAAPALRWATLSAILATSGEALATSEANQCLTALLGAPKRAPAAAGEGDEGDGGGGEAADAEAPIDPDALLSADDMADSVLGLQH